MVRAPHRVYALTAALLLAIIIAGPAGTLVVALGKPAHHCHCPGHVPAPIQGPTLGPCGDEAKAVAAASPTALPDRPAAVVYLPIAGELDELPGHWPESRPPLPETPPPRSLRV